MGEQVVDEKSKTLVPRLYLEGMKRAPTEAAPSSLSVPSSPRPSLQKQSSAKFNCLCAPTTHAGSFRCRYHRNNAPALTRNSISVGSKLSELAAAASSDISNRNL